MKTAEEIRKDAYSIHIPETPIEFPRAPQQSEAALSRERGRPFLRIFGPGGKEIVKQADKSQEVIFVDENTGIVERAILTPLQTDRHPMSNARPTTVIGGAPAARSYYQQHQEELKNSSRPIDPLQFNWGFNRVTGASIVCGCLHPSVNRSEHAVTCAVYISRGLVVYYPSNKNTAHMGAVED